MLNNFIIEESQKKNKEAFTVWRAIDDVCLQELDEQKIYRKGFRIPHYLATSINKQVAMARLQYTPEGETGTLLEIEIPQECLHAVYVDQLSAYGDSEFNNNGEKEVLIVPFSVF